MQRKSYNRTRKLLIFELYLVTRSFSSSGQSLLLTTALGTEPPKKKLKSEESLVKKRSL